MLNKRYLLWPLVVFSIALAGCEQDEVTETVFRKTLEFQLKGECKDEACKQAVSEQIKACMEKANWREYITKKDDEKVQEQFVSQFFPCFVDAEGKSYF